MVSYTIHSSIWRLNCTRFFPKEVWDVVCANRKSGADRKEQTKNAESRLRSPMNGAISCRNAFIIATIVESGKWRSIVRSSGSAPLFRGKSEEFVSMDNDLHWQKRVCAEKISTGWSQDSFVLPVSGARSKPVSLNFGPVFWAGRQYFGRPGTFPKKYRPRLRTVFKILPFFPPLNFTFAPAFLKATCFKKIKF